MIIKLTLGGKELEDALIDSAELLHQVESYKLSPSVVTNTDGTVTLTLSNEGKKAK